jgi:hypothetical protein
MEDVFVGRFQAVNAYEGDKKQKEMHPILWAMYWDDNKEKSMKHIALQPWGRKEEDDKDDDGVQEIG